MWVVPLPEQADVGGPFTRAGRCGWSLYPSRQMWVVPLPEQADVGSPITRAGRCGWSLYPRVFFFLMMVKIELTSDQIMSCR